MEVSCVSDDQLQTTIGNNFDTLGHPTCTQMLTEVLCGHADVEFCSEKWDHSDVFGLPTVTSELFLES